MPRSWFRRPASALFFATSLLLTACGGGSSAPDPLEQVPVYGPAGIASPPGASDVTPEQLRALLAGGGDLRWLQAGTMADDLAAERSAVEADAALLASTTDPTLAARRDTPLVPDDAVTALADGNRRLLLSSPDGDSSVVLNGVAQRARDIAASVRALSSRDDALAHYTRMREALPEAVLGDLPAPDTLGALGIDEVRALAALAVQRVIETASNESPLSSEAAASGASSDGARKQSLGLARRLAANTFTGCSHDDNLSAFTDFDFSLKSHLTPVRDQGNRGTCAAHAVMGSIEAEVHWAFGRKTNLSEQQLYAQSKGAWFTTPMAFGDGLVPANVMKKLAFTLYPLRTEQAWSYNKSSERTEFVVPPNGGLYQGSCNGYTEACSDTNHQLGLACTTVNGNKICAQISPTSSGASQAERYSLLGSVNLWGPVLPQVMDSIRGYVLVGSAVVISVDTDLCLAKRSSRWSKVNDEWQSFGIKPFLNSIRCDMSSDSIVGSHAMLAVGWITDAQLLDLYGSNAPKADGGGYFIVKNSWGCNAGDGGYVYMSYNYLRNRIHGAVIGRKVAGNYATIGLTYSTTQSVIANPGAKGKIVEPVTLTLKAGVNSLVKKVAFFRKNNPSIGTRLATIEGAGPYTHQLPLGYGDNGDNVFYAFAYDGDGNAVASNVITIPVRIPGAPTVSLASSATDVVSGNSFTLTAAAASTDGSGITRVEFWHGFTKLGEDTTAPYEQVVTPARGETGNLFYSARALNGNGYVTTSAARMVRVRTIGRPLISSFTASPQILAAAGTTKLEWSVSGADSIVLNPGAIDVTGTSSSNVFLTATTALTLVATNAAGSTQATVTVTLTPPPTIGSFTATPSTTPIGGGTVTLAWSAGNAAAASIDNGVGDVTGLSSKAVNVTTSKTYTLTVFNASGTATRQVSVSVPATPPPLPSIAAFAATPASLAYPGGASTLSWAVTGADTLAIDQGVGDVSGTTSKGVNVGTTATYTLSATNGGGTSTAQVTVTVDSAPPPPPPVITSFGANPASLPAGGGSSTLSWSVSGATSLSIDNGVGSVSGLTSTAVTVSATTTYMLTATNAGGSTTAQATVSTADAAGDRFVDPLAGNNANPGSSALPWRTVGFGLANIGGGSGTLWLKNGSYGRAAEGMGANERLAVPAGRVLRGVQVGGAVLRFGLAMSGSATIADLAFDESDTLDSAVYATGGDVVLRRLTFANAGWCDAGAVRGGGSANITLDDGGTLTHEYAGAGIRGFVRLVGDARLTISGGRISGAGNDICGPAAVLSTGNTAVLTLNGVTIGNSAFPDATNGTDGPIVAAYGSSSVRLTDTVIDGATVGPDGGSNGVRTGDNGTAVLQGTTIRNMAGNGAAVYVGGTGTVQVTGSTLTANGKGIYAGGQTVTVASTQIRDNRLVGIEMIGGGQLAITGSAISGNWPALAPLSNAPRASAIALWGGGDYTFLMRGSTVSGNGNAAAASPAIALEGGAASSHDLGSAADGSLNQLTGNANTSLEVKVNAAVTVRASGNRWSASTQGTDGAGLYQLGTPPCGATGPCQVGSGSGANYRLLSGTLRLVD